MKIVVIGGSGRIGSKLMNILRDEGHDAVSASPQSGVNAVTGQGLAEALVNCDVVVDVSNSPSWADQAVMDFFEKSTRNLLAAETAAGVRHHVALSVVGADRMHGSGYMRAKVAQENLIKASRVPYTILRATQFMEFVEAIAESCVVGNEVRAPRAQIQPVAADDVALTLAEITVAEPVRGIVELAGPQPFTFEDILRRTLRAKHDDRPVITDPAATYYGEALEDRTLLPGDGPRLGTVQMTNWLERSLAHA